MSQLTTFGMTMSQLITSGMTMSQMTTSGVTMSQMTTSGVKILVDWVTWMSDTKRLFSLFFLPFVLTEQSEYSILSSARCGSVLKQEKEGGDSEHVS